MTTYLFKAYDATGFKTVGKVDGVDPHSVDVELRAKGLRPYFIREFAAVKRTVKKRRRRRRILYATGAFAILIAYISASILVRTAGREQEPGLEEYKRMGLVSDAEGKFIAKTDEGRKFASDIYQVWENFYPGVLERIEVKSILLTFNVSKDVRRIPESDLEMLVTNTVRAHQRIFDTSTSRLLLVQDDLPFLEVKFSALLNTMNIRTY